MRVKTRLSVPTKPTWVKEERSADRRAEALGEFAKPTWVKPTVTEANHTQVSMAIVAGAPPLCVAVANPLVHFTEQQYRHTFTLAPIPGYSVEPLPESESRRRPTDFEQLRADETTGLIRRKATEAIDRCAAKLWLGVESERNDD